MPHPWRIDDKQIVDADGHPVNVTSVLDALSRDDGEEIRKEFPEIRFSQNSLEFVIEISGSLPESLQLAIGVWKNGQCFASSLHSDQVVLNETWHRTAKESVEVAEALIGRHNLQPGPLKLGIYLRLLTDSTFKQVVKDLSIKDQVPDSWAMLSELEPPPGLLATLYPYQHSGSAVLRTLAKNDVGSLLADEMGLGKTMQVIALLLDTVDEGPSLVVMPASLLVNWERELLQFAPTLQVLRHAGSNRTGVISGLKGHDVVLCSYETVLSDLSFLEEITWNIIALDEAQQIKNPDSQRSRVVKSLKCRVPVAITGTPVENYLTDMWSLYEFVLPELLGDRESFEEEYENNVEAAESLGQLVKNFTVRRKVLEVAQDLPPRIDALVPFDPPFNTRHEYDSLVESTPNKFMISTSLRVLCAHSEKHIEKRQFNESPKVQRLLSISAEVFQQNQKILVFASFTNTLDRLRSAMFHLQHDFPKMHVEVIDGRLPSLLRQEVIDAFNDSNEPGCLLLNPSAAGVGLNITGANHVVHFNPEWNPAKTEQATARAYRKKQTLPVFVSHFYYQSTVEQDVVESADEKRRLAAAVYSGVSAD
jgi:SNF2 family DNA or RNA helicase